MGALVIAAAPAALAAAPVLDESAAVDQSAPADAGKRSGAVLSDIRAADQREAELRHERRDGPFHPVASGALDYGEAGARFGASRSGHVHEGQDVFAPTGTPLVAVADGEVVETGSDGGRGNYVSIHDSEADRTYIYFHMVEPASVEQGEAVRAGQRIGAVGCTGSCFGEHLHFEVRRGSDPYGQSEDPLPLLEKLPQAP